MKFTDFFNCELYNGEYPTKKMNMDEYLPVEKKWSEIMANFISNFELELRHVKFSNAFFASLKWTP